MCNTSVIQSSVMPAYNLNSFMLQGCAAEILRRNENVGRDCKHTFVILDACQIMSLMTEQLASAAHFPEGDQLYKQNDVLVTPRIDGDSSQIGLN